MIDKGKVIQGLELCGYYPDHPEQECKWTHSCLQCPYCWTDDEMSTARNCKSLYTDALGLLQEQKTGHWIYEDRCYGSWTHKCSECGKRMTTAVNTYADFCWNCGAKMTGETIPEIAYTTDSPTGLSYADEDDLK